MSDSPESSAATRESGAAVRVPAPPLLFAAPLSATLALQKWLPLPLPGRPVTKTVGAVLTIAGLALSGSGAATFRRNRTTVVPHHPVSALVTKARTGLAATRCTPASPPRTWAPRSGSEHGGRLSSPRSRCLPRTAGSLCQRRSTSSAGSVPNTSATNPRSGAGSEAPGRDGIASQVTGQEVCGWHGGAQRACATLAVIDVGRPQWCSAQQPPCRRTGPLRTESVHGQGSAYGASSTPS